MTSNLGDSAKSRSGADASARPRRHFVLPFSCSIFHAPTPIGLPSLPAGISPCHHLQKHADLFVTCVQALQTTLRALASIAKRASVADALRRICDGLDGFQLRRCRLNATGVF